MLPVVADPGLYRSNAEVALSAREPWNLELTTEGAIDPIFQFDRRSGSQSRDPGQPAGHVLALSGDAGQARRHGAGAARRSADAQFVRPPRADGHAALRSRAAPCFWRSTAPIAGAICTKNTSTASGPALIDRVGRSKALGGRYPFTLSTDKSVYRTGDRVTIRARAADTAESTNVVLDLRGEIELAGQTATPLEIETLADQPGVAEAAFTASEAGAYSVRVLPGNIAAQGDPAVRPATLNFRVEPAHSGARSSEARSGAARRRGPRQRRLGGFAGRLRRLPDAFKIKQVDRLLEYRDELWDAPIVFGSLMCLLTLEWLLRKRSRMA